MDGDAQLTVIAQLICICGLLNQPGRVPQFVALMGRILVRLFQLELVSFLEGRFGYRNIFEGLVESFMTVFHLVVPSNYVPDFLLESLIPQELVCMFQPVAIEAVRQALAVVVGFEDSVRYLAGVETD